MKPEIREEVREAWGSRAGFVLAAVGSAVGLGNLWGFPYKVYNYGGGAFLIPYFIAMAVMGIPLLIMEFSVGHWAQRAAPGAFGRIVGRYRYVGWWLVALAFVIITFYTVILGYCVIYLVESIHSLAGGSLPWAETTELAGTQAAKAHYFGKILAFEESFALSGMRWSVLVSTLASWLMIYLCLFRGVKWVSKVVLVTVPLPWIMLAILTLRGLTLEGAMTGLHFYLEPDWTKLAEATTWQRAFSQVFFSMSLGFAVMLSYASFLHRRSDLNNNAMIIGLGDFATSFVAGIAVFSTLGAMAMADNVAVADVVAKGPSLAFVTFPYALSRLPALQGTFSLIFFVALLTLGIDSAFSIVEACLASVDESRRNWSRRYVLPAICIAGAAVGVLYCFGGGGLMWLGLAADLIDGPMGILVVALAECIVVGWAYQGKFLRKIRDHANERSEWKIGRWWDAIVKYIAPGMLAILMAWSVSDYVAKKQVLLLIGSGVFILIPVLFYAFSTKRDRNTVEAEIGEADSGLAAKLLVGVPSVSVLMGVILGWIRLSNATPVAATAAAVEKFQEKELGATAYILLAIAVLTIVGGLIWCFWKAMQAAGNRNGNVDTAYS